MGTQVGRQDYQGRLKRITYDLLRQKKTIDEEGVARMGGGMLFIFVLQEKMKKRLIPKSLGR